MFSSIPLFSGDAKGPLWGKNYYVPFLPYYSFPGMEAAPGRKSDLSFNLSQYLVQDIVTEFHQYGDTLIKERYIDYEGYIFEPTVSFNPLDTLEIGLTTRFHVYYGGFLDPVFEAFHSLFSFPNGGRESYGQNDVFINLHTTSGMDFSLDEPTAAFGDTDLFVKWSFLHLKFMDLALFSAIKLPTGSIASVTGSGYGDVALSLLADFYITKWLAVYVQNGFTVPGQMLLKNTLSPEPIYSLLTSVEFILSRKISLIAQFRLCTSPIKEGVTVPENITHSVKLHKPMTDIQAGVVMDLSGYRLQMGFEEDAFTNNGADLIVNISLSKSFNLHR